MKNTLISALLATVAVPLVAIAQTTETEEELPTQTEEPADPAPDAGAATTDEPAAEAEDEATTTADEPADAETTTTDDAAPMDDAGTVAESDDVAADDAAEMAGAEEVEGPFVTVPLTGAWRVTNLEGKSVEDANGESIGDISDVLVNAEGEVIAVLVGVGGFLGIGEKHVAVAMSALEFGPGKTEGLPTEEEMQAEQEQAMNVPGTGTTGTGGTMTAPPPTTVAPATPEPTTPVVGEDNLPDRIVLNVTRQELEAAPAYEDVEEGAVEEPGAETEIPPAE